MLGIVFKGTYAGCIRWRTVGVLFLLVSLLWPAVVAQGGVLVEPGTIRIGLMQQVPVVEFAAQGDYQIIDMGSKQTVAVPQPGEKWQVRTSGTRLELLREGVLINAFTGTGSLQVRENKYQVAVLSGSGALVNRSSGEEMTALGAGGRSVPVQNLSGLNILSAQGQVIAVQPGGQNLLVLYTEGRGQRYRGNLEVRRDEQGLTVINELPVEEYLYGVVPSEMPASWPAEALKAQAVAARSYTLAHLGSYGRYGFDLLATQGSQVYKGYDGENPATTHAAEETRGLIMTYRGLPVDAVFHSSSGGATENSEEVWKNPVDYLRARPDPADFNDKYYNWKVVYSMDQLINQLNTNGYQFSEVHDLIELERTSTDKRVKRLVIKGLDMNGNSVLEEVYNANAVRVVLGLKSAFFTMQKEADQQQKLLRVIFEGNGWGHGLGMSQYGALGLARQGYSYQDILKYYYTGVTLSGNYGGQG